MERREEGGSGRDRGVDLTSARPPPLIVAFARRKAAVEDRDALAEAFLQSGSEDRRQRDLRNEEQCLLPAAHRLPHDFYIDFGFSAAGNSFEKKRRERSERRLDRVDRVLLLGGIADLTDGSRIETGEERVECVTARTALDANHAFACQRVDRRRSDRQCAEQRLTAARAQKLDRRTLLRRPIAVVDQDSEAIEANAHRVSQSIPNRADAALAQALNCR